MQYNGTIQYKIKSGGGMDPKGNPMPVTFTWCDPIDCSIKTLYHKHDIYREGKFKNSSYEVLLETQDFEADLVRLTNIKGKVLGEFEVKDIAYIERSGRVKLTV